MTRVGIIGIGHTAFGRRSDATVQELAFEAYREALATFTKRQRRFGRTGAQLRGSA